MQATYQRETFGAVIDEAMPLLERHWREIAHFPDIVLNVDRERYLLAEVAGTVRVYTARVPPCSMGISGDLIGYAAFFVARNPHYADSLQATQDVIYLDPPFRRGRIGLGLLQFCERELEAEGVEVVMHHVKLAHPQLGAILDRMGYQDVDVIKAKRLAPRVAHG